MSLSPQFLDELRARTSLHQLVGRDVRLTKKGSEWQACCPFHNERTPSFYVNEGKGFYHCFGCSAHGDAIKWLTDHRGMEFLDAVRELAAAAGLDMPVRDSRAREEADRRAPLFEAVERAAELFSRQRDARAPAAYMERRGIDRDLAQRFGIGFAPDSRSFLVDNLHGIGREALIEAGLLILPDNAERGPYDRFRGRLMFPIHDQRGRPIGFGGRVIGTGEPKYLNSPETPLFDKGRTLFNLHRAAGPARRAGRLLIVEGYMDVIGLARAGIDEAVAPNGTAMTEAQIALAWRHADEPVMMLDGDGAGARAMVKAAVRALPGLTAGRSLRFAALPAGRDPDDVAREGGLQAIDQLVEESIGLAELLWRHERASCRVEEPEARAGLKQRLIEHAQSIQDDEVRSQYFAEFRRRFDELLPNVARESPQPAREARKGSWKRQQREVAPIAATRTVARSGLADQVRVAIVAGLLRFPDVVVAEFERCCRLNAPGSVGERLSALIDASGGEVIDGEWTTIAAAVRLPFPFLGDGDVAIAREALVDTLYAETDR